MSKYIWVVSIFTIMNMSINIHVQVFVWLYFGCLFFKMGSCYVAQGCFKLLGSSDFSAATLQMLVVQACSSAASFDVFIVVSGLYPRVEFLDNMVASMLNLLSTSDWF
jgi:hypothetical protein